MLSEALKRLLNRLFPEKTEIQKVEAALRRYQAKYDQIQSGFKAGRDICCPTCKYPELISLGDKIERVEKWLKILKMKEAETEGPTGVTA